MKVFNSELSFIDHIHSPWTLISALGIVIIASARLAYALIAALAILWVYIIAVLVTSSVRKYFPKIFNKLLDAVLFAVLGCVFYLLVDIFNPFLAAEMILLLTLPPILCYGSDICERTECEALDEALYKAIYEALLVGVFTIALSLLREPLGYGALSVPGSDYAVYELFNLDSVYPLPVQIISSSAGALLLLGYIFVILRMIGARPGKTGGTEMINVETLISEKKEKKEKGEGK
jgi:Na+-translocating ferredoxin:NAD+ oxidoreductase RnfE subunit